MYMNKYICVLHSFETTCQCSLAQTSATFLTGVMPLEAMRQKGPKPNGQGADHLITRQRLDIGKADANSIGESL